MFPRPSLSKSRPKLICVHSSQFVDTNTHNSLGQDMIGRNQETSPTEIRFRTWSELVTALKECQDSQTNANTLVISQRVLNCLVEKLCLPSHSASSTYVRSSEKYSQTRWWFKDLVFLNTGSLENFVRAMVSRELDHSTVSKFLFYYRKYKVSGAQPAEKRDISEAVITLLCLLDARSISFKGLFNIYRTTSTLKLNKQHRKMLESLIGSQLDQATLDYLLTPPPKRKSYIYDVDMVLKLVKSFLGILDRCRLPMSRLNKVGRLIDSYLTEVALDSNMKHSKFSELVMILPDCAREAHDGLYQAMDMYLEVHSELSEEAKISLCCVLNYEKLSAEALNHLARNSKFPSRISVKAFTSQSSKLTRLIREIYRFKSFGDQSMFCDSSKEVDCASEDDKKASDNLQQLMHGNKMELKKDNWQEIATNLDMANIRKSRLSASGNRRYFPKLCVC